MALETKIKGLDSHSIHSFIHSFIDVLPSTARFRHYLLLLITSRAYLLVYNIRYLPRYVDT